MEISRRPIHSANASFGMVSNAPEFSTQETPRRFAGDMGNYQFRQQFHGTLGHHGQLADNNMNNYDQQNQQLINKGYGIDACNMRQLRAHEMYMHHARQKQTQATAVHHAPQQHTQAISGHHVQPQYIQAAPVHSFQQQPQAYNSYAGNNMNDVDQRYQQMARRDAEYMGSSHTQQQQFQMLINSVHPCKRYNHARNNISDIAEQHQGTAVEYAGRFINNQTNQRGGMVGRGAGGFTSHQSNQHGGMIGRDANGTNQHQLRGRPQGMTDRLSQRQDTTGNIAPTHAHGYPPVQPVNSSNEFEPGRQHAMPPNYAQPPSMIYSNTERGTVSGPQNPIATLTLTNFGIQMAQSNNEQDVEKPPQSVDLNTHVREDPKNFPLKITTLAFPTAMPTQVPPQAMEIQTPPWNMPAPALLPAAAGPATSKKLQNPQTGRMAPGKGKKNAKEASTGRRRGQNTPDIQPVFEPVVEPVVEPTRSIATFARHGYDITLSNLAPANLSRVAQNIPEEDRELFEILNVELGEVQPSQNLVTGVMRELLENSIAHFSLDTSSDTRQNLEYYQKTHNLGYHSGNLTQFVPRSEFVNTVEGGPSTAKINVEVDQTSIISYESIKGSFYGRSMMGNRTMYTRTMFVGVDHPLRYAVGIKIENVMIDGRNAQAMLNYERFLPADMQGEPRWSDICDLLKSQHAEWNYASPNYN